MVFTEPGQAENRFFGLNTMEKINKSGILIFFIISIITSVFYNNVSAESGQNNNKTYNRITKLALGVEFLTLDIGETYRFDIKYEPAASDLPWLNWYISDETLLTIDPDELTVTAKAAGSVRIMAESFDGNVSAVCSVTINGIVPKDAYDMNTGDSFLNLSEKDREKITAMKINHYLDFISGSVYTAKSFGSTAERWFNAAAKVRPGTEEAESKLAYSLGMQDAEPLLNLSTITLVGTLEQIIAFATDNDDLVEVFELEPKFFIESIDDDFSSESIIRTVKNSGHTEDLTSISTAHELGYNGNGVTIAIIDSGLDSSHEQFEGRVIAEKCFSSNFTETENGYTYTARSVCEGGKSTANTAAPSGAKDINRFYHGSHVAGIAAGKDGIAPKANIVAVQAFTEVWRGSKYMGNTMYTSDELKAYNFLLDLVKTGTKITAVNMSYASDEAWDINCDNITENKTSVEAINQLVDAGIIPVAAAGNDGMNGSISMPACLSNVFAVGALANLTTPKISNYSNHSRLIGIAAPGTSIYSAIYPSGYGTMSGTSMAAPMVTGAIALLKQAYPYNKAADYQKLLKSISNITVNSRSTFDNYDDGNGTVFSYKTGVLNFSKFGDYVMDPLSITDSKVIGGNNQIQITVALDKKATGYSVKVYDLDNKKSISPELTVSTDSTGKWTVLSLSGPSLINGNHYRLKIYKYKQIGKTNYLSNTVTTYAMPSLSSIETTADPKQKGVNLSAVNKTPQSMYLDHFRDPAPENPKAPSFRNLPNTGFSAKNQTNLPNRPSGLSYGKTGLTIQIPKLNVSGTILNIPEIDGEYPVEWLGSEIGLLENSSLPGEGISILAAHNHLNDTNAGPFAFLSTLKENDRIIVSSASGSFRAYRVSGSYKIKADSFDSLSDNLHSDALVLVTCEDESIDGSYLFRRVVIADPVTYNN